MFYINPLIKNDVNRIKAELKELGWTLASPDSDMYCLNHGPVETRLKAEELYKKWNRLVNPYNL